MVRSPNTEKKKKKKTMEVLAGALITVKFSSFVTFEAHHCAEFRIWSKI